MTWYYVEIKLFRNVELYCINFHENISLENKYYIISSFIINSWLQVIGSPFYPIIYVSQSWMFIEIIDFFWGNFSPFYEKRLKMISTTIFLIKSHHKLSQLPTTWKGAHEFLTFLFWILPKLAKHFYGCLPFGQHHKIGQKTLIGVVVKHKQINDW